jgi:hypothetical protein
MALFEDLFKGGNIVAGLAIGIGAAVLGPVIIPALRPIAKTIIKTGLIAYDQGRLALADLGERTGDIMAEAQSELADATSSASDPDEQKPTRGSRKGRPQPDQSSVAFAQPD